MNFLKRTEQKNKIVKISTKYSSFAGYTDLEARIALRACSNNIDQALTFILDRRHNLRVARRRARAERRIKMSLTKTNNTAFANARSILSLSEKGFDKNLCALALQKTDNDLKQAVSVTTPPCFHCILNIQNLQYMKLMLLFLDYPFYPDQFLLLQNNIDALRQEFEQTFVIDEKLCKQIVSLGFDEKLVQGELKKTRNNLEETIENMLKLNKDSVDGIAEAVKKIVSELPGPSTSQDAQMADEKEV